MKTKVKLTEMCRKWTNSIIFPTLSLSPLWQICANGRLWLIVLMCVDKLDLMYHSSDCKTDRELQDAALCQRGRVGRSLLTQCHISGCCNSIKTDLSRPNQEILMDAVMLPIKETSYC